MRLHSLKKVASDWRVLKQGRDRHMGFCLSNEFYQPLPFFYTREGNTVPIVGNFRGASAFLVAGGPSLRKIDLEKLKLPGMFVLAMNNAATVVRPNIWVCVDDPSHFATSVWLDPKIMKFVPIDAVEKPLWDVRNGAWKPLQIEGKQWLVGDCPNTFYLRRNEKFHAERYLWEDTFNWGNCEKWGGARSVMLVAIRLLFVLGFRQVYLCGVDFEMSEEKKYVFDQGRNEGAINNNNNTYEELTKRFEELKPIFDKECFAVFNCSPGSKLKVFPELDFEDAIKTELSFIGDVSMERTSGMYETTYNEKVEEIVKKIADKQSRENEGKTE